jgi:hypothetical protein
MMPLIGRKIEKIRGRERETVGGGVSPARVTKRNV